MAGIPTVFALDYDKDACDTFRLNHAEAEVHCTDALSIDPADIPDASIIVGGPPCVNFSTSKVVEQTCLMDSSWFNGFFA